MLELSFLGGRVMLITKWIWHVITLTLSNWSTSFTNFITFRASLSSWKYITLIPPPLMPQGYWTTSPVIHHFLGMGMLTNTNPICWVGSRADTALQGMTEKATFTTSFCFVGVWVVCCCYCVVYFLFLEIQDRASPLSLANEVTNSSLIPSKFHLTNYPDTLFLRGEPWAQYKHAGHTPHATSICKAVPWKQKCQGGHEGNRQPPDEPWIKGWRKQLSAGWLRQIAFHRAACINTAP